MGQPLYGENLFTSKLNKMNTTDINGNWNTIKGKLKKKFATLTENDLLFTDGMKEVMIERLQLKLGKTREELQRIIAAL